MDRGQEGGVVSEVRLCPNVLFRELSGEAVLLDLNSERYYGLDQIGTRIWQLVSQERRIDVVLQAMLAEYEVSATQLQQELDEFLHQLAEAGLIELERLPPAPVEKVS